MSHSPIRKPKKDFFDALGDFIRLPIAVVSGTFTGKLLAKLLGFDGLDEMMIVIVTATLLTVFEVVSLRRWAIEKDIFALVLGILIATTSISGSVGYFYINFRESVLASDDYQQQKAIFESWLAKTDKKEYKDTFAWNGVKAEEAKAKLDRIRHSGAGVGNAYYEMVAKFTGWSMETSALAATLYIALIIELILIYSAVKTEGEWESEKRQQVDLVGTKTTVPETSPAPAFKMGFHSEDNRQKKNDETREIVPSEPVEKVVEKPIYIKEIKTVSKPIEEVNAVRLDKVDEKHRELVELVRCGKTTAEISEMLNYSVAQVNAIKRLYGFSDGKRGRKSKQ